MGGCCARQQELYFDKNNCFNYSTDDIIKINVAIKPELKLERKKETTKEEEIELSKIINELKKIYKDKASTISEIELFNLAIYNKESYKNNNYLIFDMRKSCEQKEEYLKRIKHINYTYEQIQKIEKLNKLEILQNFINDKIIIVIISEYYLDPKNNKEGCRKVDTYPLELCHLLYQINNNISFKILNRCLNKTEEPKNKFEEYLSVFHSYDIIPFILLSYMHVTTLHKEGFFFISFLNKQLFSFNNYIDYLNNPENTGNNEIYLKNKFLNDINITCIINIYYNSQKQFDIKEYQYQKKVFKEINLNKEDLNNKKEQINTNCEWIKQEIKKGNSCYFNIENYEINNNEYLNINNKWIFVIVILITNITEVEYFTVIDYLKEKMIYFDNINELINENINKNEILQTLNYLRSK